MDQDIRRAQLVTSFRDRSLTWLMKFSSTQNHVLADIKETMIKEFKKPKSESQFITELKEIQQRRGGTYWGRLTCDRNTWARVTFGLRRVLKDNRSALWGYQRVSNRRGFSGF